MNKKITAKEIRENALSFDKALENKNLEKIRDSFTENCEIELLNVKLFGKSGVEKWFKWFFSHIEKLELLPITIMIEGNIFFKEFLVKASLKDGKKATSKKAEVLVYEDLKIKSLRLYFDRLDFSSSIAKDFISKTIINQIIKKSLEGLN